MHVTIVSTYPPRACGLATFSRDQRGGLLAAGHTVDVVSVVHEPAGAARAPEVAFELRQHERADYAAAAAHIAASDADVVLVQHEFGIFGGNEGLFVLELMDAVPQPVVTVLHTVLPRPEPHYHRAMQRIAERSARLVVMTHTARALLASVYGVDPGRVAVVPHGTPAVTTPCPPDAKARLGLDGRTVLLTFGLLGPSKGIEFALASLSPAIEAQPDLLYVVLGATHPEIVRREGEAYRERLLAEVERRGLSAHVRFEDRYVDNEDLWAWLCAADVYVSPYPGLDQICSGTLAFALAAGLPVVSTPYLHAREVLADGAGVLVDPDDTAAMGAALARLAADPAARAEVGARARAFGRTTAWPRVGREVGEVCAAAVADATPARPDRPAAPSVALPAVLGALAALTDDTGLFQHAACGVPDRAHGYCTDDAARALVVAYAAADRLDVPAADRAAALRLARTCLGFVAHAQRADGAFENEMGFDRTWRPETATEDTVGRAMWGLGATVAWSPDAGARRLAAERLDRALAATLTHPRAQAYAAAGLDLALARVPGHSTWLARLAALADALAAHADRCSRPDWRWVADEMTYASAIVPHALLAAARHHPADTRADDWRALGRALLDTVLARTLDGDRFEPVGNDGWLHRDRPEARARFDQQPIEAGYMAWVAAQAARDTGEARYAEAARTATAWFFGHNRLGVPMVDDHTGAAFDGLTAQGVNLNQGAESTLALALALLADVPDASDAPDEAPTARLATDRPAEAARPRALPAQHG